MLQNNYSSLYYFKDFTFRNYRKILKIAKSKYKFASYSDDLDEKTIIWRHDLEFSIPNALKMAEIESNLQIKANYFLQVHSEFYNILDKNSFDSIIRVKKLGHNIGLHFDPHFWRIKNEHELEKYLEIDKNTLEKYFGVDIKMFSFHNTNKFILSCDKDKYANMVNVYSKYYKTKVGYCSDSTGYWRYERLEERLREAKDKNLQVLIHDGMWQDKVMSPRQRVFKTIDDRANWLKNNYDNILKKFKAKNVDWNEIL